MGKEMYLKLTNPDFTDQLDLNKDEYDYSKAYNRELKSDAVFESAFNHVMDGINDKQKLFEEILKGHPSTTNIEFNDVWHHFEEEAI